MGNFDLTLSLELQKISALCALAKKDSVTRDLLSTVSSPNSCVRAATSPTITVLVENLSMAINSPTKTSNSDILVQGSCQWRMLVQILMGRSSFFVQLKLNGLMASMLYLGPLLKVWMS